MKKVVFAAPGELTTLTGGYAYDRRIVTELGASNWRCEFVNLGAGFPFPGDDVRAAARRRLAALPSDAPLVIDGLAFGALPDVAAALCASRRLIALVHHPLALESGLSPRDAEMLRASERRALACARRVIATSAFTARLLARDYGVPRDRIAIVEPGCDKAARREVSSKGPVAMLAVGAIVHRKGYDVLLPAIARLIDLSWTLVIVGDCSRDVEAFARLNRDIARFDLADRVFVAGAVSSERLAALYAGADLFVLASRFEGYGMAFAEAIGHGVPIVATNAGAIAETVPASAGILVSPDDAGALSSALRRLIENPEERRRCAAMAWRQAAQLPTWEHSAALFSRAIDAFA